MDADREQQMLHAAELYYYGNLTQAAIAERLGTTRWTVGRLLEDARESGLVTITINHPKARDRSLETRLRDAFGLDEVMVVPAQGTDGATLEAVARVAAQWVCDLRPVPASLAVAWGRTLAAVARAMPDEWADGVQVFQVNGGVTLSSDDWVVASIGTMARKGHGTGHMLPAPTIVEDPALAAFLRREPAIAGTLAGAAGADVALFSPGTLTSDSVLLRSGYLEEADFDGLRERGARADVFSHYVGDDGAPVSYEMERRTIAADLDALRGVRRRMCVATGVGKAEPLAVTLRAGFATALVVDAELAEAALVL